MVLRVMDDIKFEDVDFLQGKLLRNVFEEMCVFGSKTDFSWIGGGGFSSKKCLKSRGDFEIVFLT